MAWPNKVGKKQPLKVDLYSHFAMQNGFFLQPGAAKKGMGAFYKIRAYHCGKTKLAHLLLPAQFLISPMLAGG
jgi:hypothetical protein